MNPRAVVTGAGGFIGHHMVKFLKAHGYWVRGVDTEAPEFEESEADEFLLTDLRELDACRKSTSEVEEVYQLAADMGGIGYITEFRADVARNNVLINAHMLEASRENQVSRYFFSSSACIYPMYRQESPDVTPLKRRTLCPPHRRKATDGRSCTRRSCVSTTRRKASFSREWLASTTSTVRSGRTRVEGEGAGSHLSQARARP